MLESQIEVGPVRLAEYPEIAEIHRRSFIDTYTGIAPDITEAVLGEHADEQWAAWKAAKYRDEVTYGIAALTVARYDGRPAGFCKVEKSGRGGALYVDPAYTGRIIGPYLLQPALEIGAEQGLTITVVPNTPAVRFYERIGLRPTGRDLRYELPRLRSGHTLPVVELGLSAEGAAKALKRVSALQARRLTTVSS